MTEEGLTLYAESRLQTMRTLLWTALSFSSLTAWADPFITYHADLMRVLGNDQYSHSRKCTGPLSRT